MTSEDDDWGVVPDEGAEPDLDDAESGDADVAWSADEPPDDGRSSMRRALALVHRLRLLGVTDVVLAPGSRSGPIALVLHRLDANGTLRVHVRVDEREAGFLALGLAQASGVTVPVVTTSGTAAANLHPAMLEALHSATPVLAVTADRPTRLRFTGANQTTDQIDLFPGIGTIRTVEELDLNHRDGPRHLNLELDEPLVERWPESMADGTASGESSGAVGESSADRATLLDLGPRTIVIAGDRSPDWIIGVADRAGWPVVAEPSSGSRRGGALVAGRLLLEHPPLADRIERVVSVGHATLSRSVTRLLAREDLPIVHVGGHQTFPSQMRPNVTGCDAVDVRGRGDRAWLTQWQEADRRAVAAIDARLDGSTPFDVARTVWEAVEGGLLVVGSSSPVRDLDLVARPADDGRLVVANRGLAGIDGTVSTAVGAALADQAPRWWGADLPRGADLPPGARHPRRAIALIGDLTFLHGANGLLIGPAEPRPDLTVVVADDDGGSIFATLEQGAPEHAESFERFFATPTGTDLAALCAAHHVPHRRVEPWHLGQALATAPRGIEVISVPISRSDRRALDVELRDVALAAIVT